MYGNYVTVCINGNINLCAKVTKVGNKKSMSGNKTTTIKLLRNTIDIKENMDLYDRLIILAKSTRYIDKKVPFEIMNFPLHPDHCFPLMVQCYDAQTCLS